MNLQFPAQVSYFALLLVSEKHESFLWLGIYKVSVHSLVSNKEIPWCNPSQNQVSWHPSFLNLTEICRKCSFEISFCYDKFSWNEVTVIKATVGNRADTACSCSPFSQSRPDKGWSLTQIHWLAFPIHCSPVVHQSLWGDAGVLGALSE